MIQITETAIDVGQVLADVYSEAAGAVNVFIGTVRASTAGKKVERLEYEAYDSMALSEMRKIADKAKAQWAIQKLVVIHRKGVLQIGEAAVVIAVATPHRQDSFEACKFTIDTLKETVPIWKKEVYEDGEVWVAAHP
ncbi:MAG: molybdenum cofactor biosynthesis protein MoaE [Cyclobacteriaceae bacterium]